MGWLNFFESKTEQRRPFGRGINARLHDEEEEFFNKSYEAFEKKDILRAYEYFFETLQNYTGDTPNQNIIVKKESNKLLFELFQGCAKVTGEITADSLRAESVITKTSSSTVALKRLLLERNYQFTYCGYFSDEEHIKLKLSLDNITMTPQKAFYPLREISLNADFDKEYTKSEFPDIALEDIAHIRTPDTEEIRMKHEHMHGWIDTANEKIIMLPSNDNEAMQSFVLLCLIFKIDYLLMPKYSIFQKSSKKVQEYFSDENLTVESKNEEIREYISELEKMDFEEFGKNFYEAKYTFEPSDKSSHEEIELFINESMAKVRWYKNNRYFQIIPTMYEYIALYLLYNYTLHPLTRSLLHIVVEVYNPDFFTSLGYDVLYDIQSSTLNKRAITSKIENAISEHHKKFKMLKPFGEKLNYTSLNEFSNSFYLQLKNLNFEES